MHAAAYAIFQRLRRWLKDTPLARVQMDTLRLCLIKVGGWVECHGKQVILHLSAGDLDPLGSDRTTHLFGGMNYPG